MPAVRATPELVLNHPANAGLCRFWAARRRSSALPPVLYPHEVDRAYESLGTHPDLVARLWDELGSALPVDCKAIFYGTPALVHSETAVVFGFACGTHEYALRLPDRERTEAIAAGAPRTKEYPKEPAVDLRDIGDEWVFCGWFRNEVA